MEFWRGTTYRNNCVRSIDAGSVSRPLGIVLCGKRAENNDVWRRGSQGKTAQPSAPNFVDFPIRRSASSLRFGRLSLLFDQFSMKERKNKGEACLPLMPIPRYSCCGIALEVEF